MRNGMIRVAGSLTMAGWLAFGAGTSQPGADVSIRQIRFSSEAQVTRVTIETSGKSRYRTARLRSPDRVYFDLQDSRSTANPRVISVADKLLQRIRVSQKEPGVTRVVLDLEPDVEVSASRLEAPDRLVIEVRRAAGAPAPPAEQIVAKQVQPAAAEETPAPAPAPVQPEPAQPEPAPAHTPSPAPAFEPAPAPAPAPPPTPVEEAAAPPAPPAVPPAPETSEPEDEASANKVRVVEEIVAKVNNDIVTRGEMDKYRARIQSEISHENLPPGQAEKLIKQAETNLLRDRIDQLLLVQKAKELDLKVDQDLSKRMAQLQVQSKISDPDKFQQYVREQSGMSYEDFKQQMKDGLLTSEVVRREVGSKITISKAEEQKYYEEHKKDFVRDEQVWLQEILISTEGKDESGVAAAEKKARELVTRARKGENFSTLARENSDADTAQDGGDLPAFKKGVLKKELEDLVFDKSKGYVTDPIRQENGFLILKVVQHDQAGLQPFEVVENEIMEKLFMPRMQPALRTYLTKLRQDAFLQIREGYVDSGAAPGKETAWQGPARLKPQTVTKEEVAKNVRRKRLLFVLPVPGTKI
jgi:peptidyl-prolyl cis-trans isomerase SurA